MAVTGAGLTRTPARGWNVRLTRLGAVLFAAALCLGLSGCATGVEPVLDSREALGTVVSVSAYPADGADEAAVRTGLDAAYDAMTGVETALDAHDPASAISRINAAGIGTLPPEARAVLDARDRLDVTQEFSPFLLEVVKLYDFEGAGSVPSAGELARVVSGQRFWQLLGDRITYAAPFLGMEPVPPAGLDFGGAAKGLALDDAAAALQNARVGAALLTAGSTTVTYGDKPDGEPWRIGVENPRDPDALIATVEAPGAVTVSTSGDYQRYFERGGVRYHHILDPTTGEPARGLRSLTVVGAANGLDSDILSTALFVMGPDKAIAYAEEHGLGLVLVDDEGRVRIVPGPANSPWKIVETTS